jgi:hypothetical protein
MTYFRNYARPQAAIVTSKDVAAVHIAEYQALRQEVNNRQTLSYALVAADLAAFGTGLSIGIKYPPALFALAIVSSLLWLFWLAQTMQIYRIAAYVALVLKPRLKELYGSDLLEWEEYVRRLTKSHAIAVAALYEQQPDKIPYISRNRDGVYISLLLGGAAPLVLSISAFAQFHTEPRALSWKAATIAGLILWIYALRSAVAVIRTTNTISHRIIENWLI